jgi:molybdenum cofactor guanylyltransferase
MPDRDVVAGVVIAGGRSLRFGGEKAIADFAGQPLLQWAAERLATACAPVAVNARPGTQAEALAAQLGLTVLHDAPGDPDGPLSGVRAGLTWAAARGARAIAVSPCDAPLLPPDLFVRLLAAAGEGAALAVTGDGRQPLCSIWPVTALPAVTAALAGGAHPPTWRLLESLGAVHVDAGPADAFANLNTREDLALLEARFTSGTGRR